MYTSPILPHTHIQIGFRLQLLAPPSIHSPQPVKAEGCSPWVWFFWGFLYCHPSVKGQLLEDFVSEIHKLGWKITERSSLCSFTLIDCEGNCSAPAVIHLHLIGSCWFLKTGRNTSGCILKLTFILVWLGWLCGCSDASPSVYSGSFSVCLPADSFDFWIVNYIVWKMWLKTRIWIVEPKTRNLKAGALDWPARLPVLPAAHSSARCLSRSLSSSPVVCASSQRQCLSHGTVISYLWARAGPLSFTPAGHLLLWHVTHPVTFPLLWGFNQCPYSYLMSAFRYSIDTWFNISILFFIIHSVKPVCGVQVLS